MEVCSYCNKPFDKNVQWKDFGSNGKYCLECEKRIKKRKKVFGIILLSIMVSFFIIITCFVGVIISGY